MHITLGGEGREGRGFIKTVWRLRRNKERKQVRKRDSAWTRRYLPMPHGLGVRFTTIRKDFFRIYLGDASHTMLLSRERYQINLLHGTHLGKRRRHMPSLTKNTVSVEDIIDQLFMKMTKGVQGVLVAAHGKRKAHSMRHQSQATLSQLQHQQ